MQNNETTALNNIDLSILRKKRFTIDDDESKILELNTSDLSVVTRLSESYPKLNDLATKVATITDGTSDNEDNIESDLNIMSKTLTTIDDEMRDLVDYIFDSNVSKMCAPSGSMYDPINGQLRYEHIITILTGLYEDNLKKEITRIKNRVTSHTKKYTG